MQASARRTTPAPDEMPSWLTWLVAIVTILAGIGLAAIWLPAEAAAVELVWSRAADRSEPVSLEGATLDGNVFVFVRIGGGPAFDRAEFMLDGQLLQVDTRGPFDLVTGPDGQPLPLDTLSLSEGPHALSVTLTFRGRATHSVARSFNVDNQGDDGEKVSDPTSEPTGSSSESPSEPTTEPTAEPTAEPTTGPTEEPSADPPSEPTEEPSSDPAAAGTVITVPMSIANDCSKDVTADLNSWIASVPDGSNSTPSVLAFTTKGCYRIEDKLIVEDRRHLVFDGNGSTFKATTAGHGDRKQWQIFGGQDIAFTDMVVQGVNTSIKDGAWNKDTEWQHNWSFWGTQGVLLDGVTGRYAYGDFVALDADYRLPVASMQPVRDVVIRNSTFYGAGRMGIFTNYADGILIENNSLDKVMWSAIDLEVEHNDWSIRNVTIRNNRVGWVRHSFVGNHGNDRPVDNIRIVGNVMTSLPGTNQPSIHIIGGSVARRGWHIEGNTFRTWTWVLHARGVRDVVVKNNTVHQAQDDAVAVELIDSHNGSVTGNDFTGYTTVLKADSLSTGWTACGNMLSASGGYTQPKSC